jgi:hypothetical protein
MSIDVCGTQGNGDFCSMSIPLNKLLAFHGYSKPKDLKWIYHFTNYYIFYEPELVHTRFHCLPGASLKVGLQLKFHWAERHVLRDLDFVVWCRVYVLWSWLDFSCCEKRSLTNKCRHHSAKLARLTSGTYKRLSRSLSTSGEIFLVSQAGDILF